MTQHLGIHPAPAAMPGRGRVFERATFAALGLALLAGCVASPEDIAPEYVQESRYEGWSCAQFATESARIDEVLTVASKQQDETRSSDAVGIFLLGLPLGTMTKDDLAPEIARLKGQREALDRGATKSRCFGAPAATEAAAPRTGPETTTAALPGAPVRAMGRLSEAELRAIMPGAVLRGKSAQGRAFVVTYHRNGSVSGLSESSADTGRWAIQGDNMCTKWSKWRKAKRRCFYFIKDGDSYTAYFTATNKLNATARLSRE